MALDNGKKWHLGLSFGHHDASAALVSQDGEVLSSHEERFTRRKFDASFPSSTLEWLISSVNLNQSNLMSVNFYEDPKLKRYRKLATLLAFQDENFSSYFSNRTSIHTNRSVIIAQIRAEISKFFGSRNFSTVNFYEHHESHAASAFFLSGFSESICLVVDAVGEFDSTSVWSFKRNKIGKVERSKIWSQGFPDSYGIFYSMLSLYCGFKVNSGEYKFMGLAPYGSPRYVQELEENFIKIGSQGDVHLNRNFLEFLKGGSFSCQQFVRIFGREARGATGEITQFHADLASSAQSILEKGLLRLVSKARELFDDQQIPICLAGGVALNAVANGKIAVEVGEENIFIPPAAGDAGTAVGCAFLGMNDNNTEATPKSFSRLNTAKLGKSWDDFQILQEINKNELVFIDYDDRGLPKYLAEKLSNGAVVGLFRGAEEWGPRALGSRSILADPRVRFGQITINEKIKFRESFRPFAPVVVAEDASKFFEISSESPFMLRVVKVRNSNLTINRTPNPSDADYDSPISIKKRIQEIESEIPSVTHLDLSARVQTVTEAQDEFLHSILRNFERISGVPILINTSFNVRGEPIVHSPQDAIDCFMTTGIDVLVLNHFVVEKTSNFHLLTKYQRKHFDVD